MFILILRDFQPRQYLNINFYKIILNYICNYSIIYAIRQTYYRQLFSLFSSLEKIEGERKKIKNTFFILVFFYESSLGIATFTLILTSILRYLQELTTEPPMWISAGTTSILRSRIGRILLVSILDPAATAKIEADVDDNTDLVQSNGKKSPWTYIVVLIGWLAFLSTLLAYIVLLSTCFPTYYDITY